MHEEKPILLDMRGICKSFIGVNALKGVDLVVREGEIHALEGENGAGKSVLIKILTGVYTKDAGTIIYQGEEVDFTVPAQAQNVGIHTIYQELNTIPYLSIAENMFLGNEIRNKNGLIDWEATYSKSEEILKSFNLNIDVKQPINMLSAAMQQMVSIAAAVSKDAKLVIMDEATSSLDEKEVALLMNIVEQLKKKNVAVIFITHRLNEVYEICEKVTIIKDGEFMGRYDVAQLDKLSLISKMIGRDASTIMDYRKEYDYDVENNEAICEFRKVEDGKRLNGVSFALKKGEVLGLAGLLGSGRTEIANTLFGNHRITHGDIRLKGKHVKIKHVKDALKNKMVLCPEERKRDAVFPDMSIKDNITMTILKEISRFGFIDLKRQEKIAQKYIERLKVKTPNTKQRIKFLSGGNQQKCIIARGLVSDPEIVILDEPTRGIDVGAKMEIELLVSDIAKKGISVIMISSILEELARDCDRVVIIREGKEVGELLREDITEEKIIHRISEAYS
ncbi:sugar ABC transporter ATP-binding protein [Christensenella timonensis]|uniref:sugar ABC transporter ATP-binding protein n=1 Tax=Christensenella timonensis TaxID=1816678 RepID=UPI00082E7A4C|nr:sugar ABC transporter ATP-binding protein [Christensenella timonensis]